MRAMHARRAVKILGRESSKVDELNLRNMCSGARHRDVQECTWTILRDPFPFVTVCSEV